MLRLLSIRNFAVLEALEVEFEPGFTVLTDSIVLANDGCLALGQSVIAAARFIAAA